MSVYGSNDQFLGARVRVPSHVVYRAFPEETVMLNLNTGKYHGLNATAGQMMEALERSASVTAALAELTHTYDAPAAQIERDVRDLCAALLERQLIELEDPGAEPAV